MPSALLRTINAGVRNETSALSLHAPRMLFNQSITGSRRFAAQDWPVERMRAIGKATGTTIHDVVLAMCSGAMRSYLEELGELPDPSMVSLVPLGLNPHSAQTTPALRGQSYGVVMVQLGTPPPDPPT